MSVHQHSAHHNMPNHLFSATVQPTAFSIERILSSGNVSAQTDPTHREKPRSKCEKTPSSPKRTSIYSVVLDCLQSKLILRNQDAPCSAFPPSSANCLPLCQPEETMIQVAEERGPTSIPNKVPPRSPPQTKRSQHPTGQSRPCHLEVGGLSESYCNHPTSPEFFLPHLSFLPSFSEAAAFAELKSEESARTDCPAHLSAFRTTGGSTLPFILNGESSYMPIPFFPTYGSLTRRCRRRKARTVFSDQQLSGLELRFQRQRYLSTPERIELASLLGLSEMQVKTWFQNRRMKHKKMQRSQSPTAKTSATHQTQAPRYATLTDREQVVGSSSLGDGLSLSSAEDDETALGHREAEDTLEDRQGAVAVAVRRATEQKERMFPAPLVEFNSNEYCSSSLTLSPSVYQRPTRLFPENNMKP